LTFGDNFNQPINSCVPDSVANLIFPLEFGGKPPNSGPE